MAELATASYRLWRPDLGFPVRTSIGPPRFLQAPLVEWPTVYPWGLFGADLDHDIYRRRYRHRLHRNTPKVLAELADLQAGYDAPLVLLCHCDLSKPDARCHRTMLAEWITQKTGEEIREVE